MSKVLDKTKAIGASKVFRGVVFVIAVAIVFISGFYISKEWSAKTEENKPQLVDTQALKSELLESSELTTAKLKLTCISEYKDTGVVLLNRGNFIMVYDVIVRAGIDIKKVNIPKDRVDYLNKIIYISIPKATIQSSSVDPATIKYFDEDLSLFNVNQKEDANEAQALAQKDARKKALDSGILELADSQSAALIKGILSSVIPKGYTIEFINQ